ncbi:hypothetical protein AAZX31_18G209800 [Glycine max]
MLKWKIVATNYFNSFILITAMRNRPDKQVLFSLRVSGSSIARVSVRTFGCISVAKMGEHAARNMHYGIPTMQSNRHFWILSITKG